MKTIKNVIAGIISLVLIGLAVVMWVVAATSGMYPHMIFVCCAVTVVALGLSWTAFQVAKL